MQEEQIEDAVIVEEVTDDGIGGVGPEEAIPAQTKLSIGGMLKALAGVIQSGNLSSQQARQMRSELGITQAHFTRKQIPKTQRLAKRKAQKAARRINRTK